MTITDIPGCEDFVKSESLNRGLSGDKKYYIETTDGRRLCLRISDISEYERKKTKHKMMEQVAALGVPMPQPVSFGTCNDGKNVYQLLTWCDGETLEAVLPTLPEATQYNIGLQSGEIMGKIHSIPSPEATEDWHDRYIHVIGDRMQAFHDCGVRFEGYESILSYYQDNRHLLKGRQQVYLHGDFHTENLLLANNQDLSIIDWELLDFEGYGDPWTEFRFDLNAIVPYYATGQIHGYFGGEPPEDFWRLLAFYMSVGSLMGIPWAYYNYPDLLDSIVEANINILRWFDNMKNPVPTWYCKDFASK